MRLREFNQQLDELKMSPGSLKAMASQIKGALVGVEFEMVVPGVEDPDEFDRDPEPDYSHDGRIRVSSWRGLEDEITEFFTGGEFGLSRGQIKQALEKANEDFIEWCDEMYVSELEDGGLERWWEENHNDEEMPEKGSRELDTAEEEYREQFYDELFNSNSTIREWLEYADYDTFSKFGSGYDLAWPYITFPESDGGDIQSLADDFGDAVGLDVDVSTSYHGQKKSTKNFTIEPDGSIRGDGAGLEFVSPPLPVDQMIEVLQKTIAWAKRRGCQTNRSTGLHMNVSVPNYNLENLDYVKLALFVGDDWVANQFGRLGANYADSSMDKIKGKIQVNPTQVPAYLDTMKAGLNKIASRLIHSNQTQKYVSLNIQDNRLEFRSPGGDWLNQDLNKLINTMLRFVVALDIACDPEKQKREYDTKLYKLIAGTKPESGDNTVKYFALYSSGKIPKAALLSYLRQAKMIRQDKKKPPAPRDPNLKEYDIMYNASDDDYQEMHERVEAKSREEAVQIFKRQNPEAVVLSIKQLNQPFNPKSGEYIVRMKENPNSNEYSISVNADSPRDAQEQIRRAYGSNTIIISVARG